MGKRIIYSAVIVFLVFGAIATFLEIDDKLFLFFLFCLPFAASVNFNVAFNNSRLRKSLLSPTIIVAFYAIVALAVFNIWEISIWTLAVFAILPLILLVWLNVRLMGR